MKRPEKFLKENKENARIRVFFFFHTNRGPHFELYAIFRFIKKTYLRDLYRCAKNWSHDID